jgi:hypothetical protein
MKPLLCILLLAAAALAQVDAPPASTIPVDQENARKARQVLDQAVQALGGSAYLGIQDISQEGRVYSFHLGQPNSVGAPFYRFYRYPDQDRVELTKKRDIVLIYSGQKGYEITFKGAHPDDPKNVSEYMRRREFSLDWVLRKWLSAPGVAYFYEGTTVTEQKPVDQVTLMNKDNQGVTLYLDRSTHLPVKKSYSWRDPTDKQRNIEDEVYDNYRPIQGVMTPFSLTRFYNGDMSNQRFINSVSYNQGLADSLFDPKAPPPKH